MTVAQDLKLEGANPPAETPKKSRQKVRPPIPDALADVALIAADTCAAIGAVSVSWWHEEVRTGRAPRPVIQQPRFTRWRRADAIRFWAERVALASADTKAGERMRAKAKKASIKAREPAAVAKAQATRAAKKAAATKATS